MDKENIPLATDDTLQGAAEWWVRLRARRKAVHAEEQWLEWSNADARRLDAFSRISELGAQLGALDDKTRREWTREFVPARSRLSWWWPISIAAALILAVSIFAWNRPAADPIDAENYATAVAINRDIALADGSHVVMGGATQLSTKFSRDRRDVDLNAGEAFFQVAHNAVRPFIVNAGEVSIRAVGTAFSVRRTGQRVTIAVAEGRVRIASSEGAANGRNSTAEALEALAGQQISFDPRASGLTVTTITPDRATSWQQRRLEFVNEPLDSVVANINRYSVRPVLLTDARLDALTFTGTVDCNSLDSWLRALPKILPLQVEANLDRVSISASEPKSR